jgi:ATP-dependent RNA helicase RhlE
MPFSSLNLPEYLRKSIEEQDFRKPTAVQQKVIPLISEGKDLMVEAQTGTGKTAAYAWPLIAQMNSNIPEEDKIEVLTLVPTRELALQVCSCFKEFSKLGPRKLKTLSIIGGESVEMQIDALENGIDIAVATPGRLLDLLHQGHIDLSSIKVLILDEADKLFNIEFTEQIELLLQQIPARRQNLLFSATLPAKVLDHSGKLITDPERITIPNDDSEQVLIEERVILVDRHKRRALLEHLIHKEQWDHCIVFVARKRAAYNLGHKLHKAGFSVDSLHGDLDQESRIEVLNDFKNKDFSILITTDLAARGIDIKKLSVVVNYDLPRSPLDYKHRIGRTGRAGETGKAISFIDHSSEAHFKIIEKKVGFKLPRETITGFEISTEPELIVKGQAPVKGKRKSKKDKLRELNNQLNNDEHKGDIQNPS